MNDKAMPGPVFSIMSFILRIRDIFMPPLSVLVEAGLEPGMKVLDYGCGPGAYSLAVAGLVGEKGMVYGLDIHPKAGLNLEKLAARKRISNLKCITTDCHTGLNEASLDRILLYDVFHMFKDKERILKELHRILKPEGRLSFSNHHMKAAQIKAGMGLGGLFELVDQGKHTYTFKKAV